MKKGLLTIVSILLILGLVMGVSGCATSGPAPATPTTPSPAATEVIKWKGQMAWNLKPPFEHFDNAGYTGGTAVAPLWVEWVKEATNGRLIIELEQAGGVVGETELLSAVKDGVLDVAIPANPGMYCGIMPEGNVMMGPPFCIQTVEECWDWLYNFGMYDEFVKVFANHNIYPIMWSSCMIANFGANFPLDSPDAIKGKKVRCSGSVSEYVKMLGGNPVTMAWTDVYQAMKLGTIDAYQGGFGALTTQHLDEVTTYYLINPNITTFTSAAMINLDSLNELPDDIKTILMRDTRYIAGSWNMSMWQESEYEKIVLSEKMTLQSWSDEDSKRIVKQAIETCWPAIADISPECARLIELSKQWAKVYGKID